jgi:hypothetical protein
MDIDQILMILQIFETHYQVVNVENQRKQEPSIATEQLENLISTTCSNKRQCIFKYKNGH